MSIVQSKALTVSMATLLSSYSFASMDRYVGREYEEYSGGGLDVGELLSLLLVGGIGFVAGKLVFLLLTSMLKGADWCVGREDLFNGLSLLVAIPFGFAVFVALIPYSKLILGWLFLLVALLVLMFLFFPQLGKSSHQSDTEAEKPKVVDQENNKHRQKILTTSAISPPDTKTIDSKNSLLLSCPNCYFQWFHDQDKSFTSGMQKCQQCDFSWKIDRDGNPLNERPNRPAKVSRTIIYKLYCIEERQDEWWVEGRSFATLESAKRHVDRLRGFVSSRSDEQAGERLTPAEPTKDSPQSPAAQILYCPYCRKKNRWTRTSHVGGEITCGSCRKSWKVDEQGDAVLNKPALKECSFCGLQTDASICSDCKKKLDKFKS